MSYLWLPEVHTSFDGPGDARQHAKREPLVGQGLVDKNAFASGHCPAHAAALVKAKDDGIDRADDRALSAVFHFGNRAGGVGRIVHGLGRDRRGGPGCRYGAFGDSRLMRGGGGHERCRRFERGRGGISGKVSVLLSSGLFILDFCMFPCSSDYLFTLKRVPGARGWLIGWLRTT